MRVLFAMAVLAAGAWAQSALLAIQDSIQRGDLAAADQLIESALQQHPQDGGVLNLRGVVHAQRNELTAAHSDFAEAVRLLPGLTPAWQNLARACQMESEQATCAITAWKHVLAARPANAEALRSLAGLLERQGRYAESLRYLEKAQRPEGTQDLAVRCVDFCGLERFPQALAVAKRLAAQTDFGEEDLAAMRLTLPGAAAVLAALVEGLDARKAAGVASLQRLVLAYEALQRLPEARGVLERVAALDPQNPAHLLELARLAETAKDHEGALSYLAHARDLAPNNGQIHYLWGVIAAEMDLPVEARRSLDRALELEPDNASYNYVMGSVIMATRDAATAASYFEKFVKAAPLEMRGHYALGVACFTAGDYERAKKEIALVANDAKFAAQAEYFQGRMARLSGQLVDAARLLKSSIERLPSFAESHTELGRVRLLEGNTEGARGEFERALKLDPHSFQANDQLLVLYKQTHDPRAAQQAELLKKLDEERSRRAELMLRTIEARPY